MSRSTRSARTPQVVGALVGLVLLSACSGDDEGRASPSNSASAQASDAPREEDDAPLFTWTADEQEALDACAAAKLGHDLDTDSARTPASTDSEDSAEADWEFQRQGRAEVQCIYETFEGRFDITHYDHEVLYQFAYALDPEGNPMMTDPLAPWSERDQ